jgi:hypothetical protein
MLINEGFGVNSAGSLAISGRSRPMCSGILALPAPYPAFIAEPSTGPPVRGELLD